MRQTCGHGITIIAAIIALSLVAPGVATAGFLTGTVTNTNGAGVVNVKVEFTETATGNPVIVFGNLTLASGFYGVTVPDGTYDVEYVTPVVPGGVVPQRLPAVTIVGTVVRDVTCPFGKVLSGTVVDTLGLPVDAVDLNVVDPSTGLLDFTPNDNTDIAGFYQVIVLPGIKDLLFRPQTAGTRLAPAIISDVVIANDLTVDVALPAGVFVSGNIVDINGQPVQNADLDYDVVSSGVRYPTPGDKTDNNGDYIVTVPADVYDVSVEPRVQDLLVAQRIFSVPINKDTVMNWVLQPGFSLSGVVNGPGGAVENCDIDVIDTLTLVKLVTPGDKTDATGFYEVVVPGGDYTVRFQPPVATRLVSVIKNGVHISQDTVVNAALVSGVLLDGTVQSGTGALINNVDLDIFDAVTKATVLVADDQTDAVGYYAIVVTAGNYDIEFEAPKSRRLVAKRVLNISIPSDQTMPIVLDTGLSISGTITGGGLPLDSVDIDAYVDATGESTLQPGDLTNPAGFYEIIVGFAPHTIVFNPPVSSGRAAKAFPGQNPGADFILNADLPSGFLITGTVLGPGGAPFEGVVLHAEVAGVWAPTSDGITNLSGQYETVLEAGTYTLKYIPPVSSGLDTLVVENVVISQATPIDVQFAAANQRPVLSAIGPKGVLAEQNLSFTISASDADGPFPSLTASGLPANATFNDLGNGTGQFDFNPTLAQIGTYPVVFIASDGVLADSETVVISVIDPNCDCPFQADMNADGFPDSVDLNLVIDALFFAGSNPQDPLCPTARADINADGFPDSVDLNLVIDLLFFAGSPPVNPCVP